MNIPQYREKVIGCWLGKAVGGTLGQPYEGCDGPLSLTYYDPVPTDMIPNDDLDLQVLWACVLDRMEHPVVDRDILAKAWLEHVDFPWDEYGVAIHNLRRGIPAPISGRHDNWFKDGLGAAIRSELWACLAPGDPQKAAAFAYEDACVDHAGDGIHAEQFFAALESAAFVESDVDKLIDVGLSVIPDDCRLKRAILDTRRWCGKSDDWLAVRDRILDKWGHENFTDAVMNIPFVILSLLLGRGDFGKSICLAANCGRDTDCAAATIGAILGIVDPSCVSDRWLKPIGRKLVLNNGVTGIEPPPTLDAFTDMVTELRGRVESRGPWDEPQPDLSRFVLHAECGVFAPWFAQDENKFSPSLPEESEIRQFSGFQCSIPASDIPNDGLFLARFKFNLEWERGLRVMVNTTSNSRVWLDGEYAFAREGGRVAPSFHRCPVNQYRDAKLAAGEHELVIGLAPIADERTIEWIMGLGELDDFQWAEGVTFLKP